MFAEQVQHWPTKSREWCPCSKRTRTNYYEVYKIELSSKLQIQQIFFTVGHELARKHNSSLLQRIKKPSQIAKTLGQYQAACTKPPNPFMKNTTLTEYNIKILFCQKIEFTYSLWIAAILLKEYRDNSESESTTSATQ